MVYLLTLSLAVGTVAAVVALCGGTLVEVYSEVVHSVDDCLNSSLHLALIVGVLYPQVEHAIGLVSDTLSDNGVIEISQMYEARGAGTYTGDAGSCGELSLGETRFDIIGSFPDVGEKKFCKCIVVHSINPLLFLCLYLLTGNI